jgi:hypothetical protein
VRSSHLSRSSNLVRSRLPTSDELSQPLAGCWHTDGRRPAGVPLRDASPLGGAAGIRTPDLRRARAALSQLSYGPRDASRPAVRQTGSVRPDRVGAPGLEPGTSALSGPRSNHLSYAPAETSAPRRPAAAAARPVAPSLLGAPWVARGPMPKTERAESSSRPPASAQPDRAWRRRPPRHPWRPCQALPPSHDGNASGLGAHRCRITTRRLDTGQRCCPEV